MYFFNQNGFPFPFYFLCIDQILWLIYSSNSSDAIDSKICGLLSPPTVRTGLIVVLGVSEVVSFAIF